MTRALVFFVLCVLSVACRSTSAAGDRAREYVLVVLRRGANTAERSEVERAEIQAAHMANIQRLAKEGVLVVAGPFGQPNTDPTRRGLFIFDVANIARARELAGTDPAVQAGVLAMECIPLRTRADLRRASTVDLGLSADVDSGALAEFPMHRFTLAIVGGGAKARAALERGIAPGRVLLVGRCGGALQGSNVAILDAPDVAHAEELLAPLRGELGALDLVPWWASETLTKLPEWALESPR